MNGRFALLAGICVLGTFAGVAGATPPGGTPPAVEPGNPIPGACLAEFHANQCFTFVVKCTTASQGNTVCTTVGVTGSRYAPVHLLALELPRRYVAISLVCRAPSAGTIGCSASSRTIGKATGMRVTALRLPQQFDSLRIGCLTSPRSGFACKLAK